MSTLLEPHNSEYILQKLVNSSFDIHGLAGIPYDVRIAHKFGTYYGEDEEYFHNCGIMYIEDARFFYCVMTKDVTTEEAETIIGSIVHGVYTYVTETRLTLNNESF